MELNPEQQKAFNTYCQNLLDGTQEPPNEFVGFMVGKLKEARVERDRCSQQVRHWSEQEVRAEGGVSRYEDDINEWVRKSLFPQALETPEIIPAAKGPRKLTKAEKAKRGVAKGPRKLTKEEIPETP